MKWSRHPAIPEMSIAKLVQCSVIRANSKRTRDLLVGKKYEVYFYADGEIVRANTLKEIFPSYPNIL